MSDQFVFTTTHEIFFSNREPVPIKEIVESLLGIERIVKMCPKALHAITGVPIDHAEVIVEHLESGSLLEKLGIRLVFRNEDELERFVEWVRENVVRKPGVSQVVLIGAVALVLKPARLDPEASLRFDGNDALQISPEAIKATPAMLEVEADETSERLLDVDLQIRATNLDHPTRGWAALIPGRVDRRVRMELDDGVSPRDVAGRFQVRADATVHYKRPPSGKKYVPAIIQVHRVIHDE